ncbi:Hypothetical protein R9X50_00468000 [Acrodontium crateriforme]|uniref:Uncharacterized protein n=1 Tax=Acrodontium crateriforme TaxID=150365 RepID=A0AAQ3M8D1_9PEZI|nr:Hypothetical protein R9X50_00468000 [Acrodontium crateriforme]
MSINFQPSYALLQPPSFDVCPDGDIVLGTILAKAKHGPERPDPKRPLNKASRVAIDAKDVRSIAAEKVILDGKQLSDISCGVWSSTPLFQAIGGKLSADRSDDKVLFIEAEGVETRYFLPQPEYFAQALKPIPIQKTLFDFTRDPVYLVTGIKIAKSAKIINTEVHTSGFDIGPVVDLTSFGIPLSVGTGIKSKGEKRRIVTVEKKSEFILAYETRRIQRKADSFTEADNNKWAVLDDEDGKGLKNAEFWLADIDIRTLTVANDGIENLT